MLDRDVVFGKIGIIQRCLLRIRRTTDLQPEKLEDLNTQDVFVLNVQRAVQAALDLAAHVIIGGMAMIQAVFLRARRKILTFLLKDLLKIRIKYALRLQHCLIMQCAR